VDVVIWPVSRSVAKAHGPEILPVPRAKAHNPYVGIKPLMVASEARRYVRPIVRVAQSVWLDPDVAATQHAGMNARTRCFRAKGLITVKVLVSSVRRRDHVQLSIQL
jgi:hypothetical protein